MSRSNDLTPRHLFWILFISSLVVITLLFSARPASAQDTQGGGLISEYPSWFVKVKSSERPFSKNHRFYEFVGSGSWIADDLVLTCWHNFRLGRSTKISPEVCIEDHNGNRYTNVEIAAVDKAADLLVVRVLGKIHPHKQVRVSTAQDTSGRVISYGLDRDGVRFRWSVGEVLTHPDGDPIRQGSVNGGIHWHVHDGLVVQGMSGGPAFDDAGELQGINVGHHSGRSSTVSLSKIQSVLDTIDR